MSGRVVLVVFGLFVAEAVGAEAVSDDQLALGAAEADGHGVPSGRCRSDMRNSTRIASAPQATPTPLHPLSSPSSTSVTTIPGAVFKFERGGSGWM